MNWRQVFSIEGSLLPIGTRVQVKLQLPAEVMSAIFNSAGDPSKVLGQMGTIAQNDGKPEFPYFITFDDAEVADTFGELAWSNDDLVVTGTQSDLSEGEGLIPHTFEQAMQQMAKAFGISANKLAEKGRVMSMLGELLAVPNPPTVDEFTEIFFKSKLNLWGKEMFEQQKPELRERLIEALSEAAADDMITLEGSGTDQRIVLTRAGRRTGRMYNSFLRG